MSHDRLRKPKISFTQVPNDLICSPELSGLAKSVYCYLISRPDDWKFFTKEIAKHMKESLNTVKKALADLITHGWIEKEQIRVKGRFSHSIFTLFYEALTVDQNTVDGKTVNQKTVDRNLVTTNTNSTNTESNNTYLDKPRKKDKKLLAKIMKFRNSFTKTYSFNGFIAHGLSEPNYDYLEYTLNDKMMIVVKETNERITKELALEIWQFLYFDYNKPEPMNKEAFMLLNHNKDEISMKLLNH